jgi:hypothetical protein
VSAKQQFFRLDRRLLGVPPRPVSVLFGWKIGFKDRFQYQQAAVMQARSRTLEIPSGLRLPLAFGINTRLIGSGR